MTALLTPEQVGAYLAVRDRRTVRRRLDELQVPVVPFGRSYRVRAADLERAVAVAVVQRGPGHSRPPGTCALVAPGERLWDDPPTNQVSRRRVNGPARGTRDETPVQKKPNDGSSAVPATLPRALTREES